MFAFSHFFGQFWVIQTHSNGRQPKQSRWAIFLNPVFIQLWWAASLCTIIVIMHHYAPGQATNIYHYLIWCSVKVALAPAEKSHYCFQGISDPLRSLSAECSSKCKFQTSFGKCGSKPPSLEVHGVQTFWLTARIKVLLGYAGWCRSLSGSALHYIALHCIALHC